MSGYVIAAALGPVGSFIAAGRRSRDLWYGSRFLSEITRRAAEDLEAKAVRLVVPLSTQLRTSFLDSYQGPTISNKILGIVDSERGDPREHLYAAEQVVRAWVAAELEGLLGDARLHHVIARKHVRAQVAAVRGGDFVEFYGAWTPIGDGDGAETLAIERASRLLTGRKTARIFAAPAAVPPGVPKSSLDPGRDSVLIEVDRRTAGNGVGPRLEARRARAGIRPDERLDAVGLARRRALFRNTDAELGRLPFPSLARVALDPWIEGALAAAPTARTAMAAVLRELGDLDAQTGRDGAALYFISSPVRDPGERHQGERRFGYDPELLLDGAVAALRKGLEKPERPTPQPTRVDDLGRDEIAPDEPGAGLDGSVTLAAKALDRIEGQVAILHRTHGVPLPYYALVEADGDGIGRLLALASEHEIRAELVEKLYEFSKQAWATIEAHDGCGFYVGGDELAAYVAADRAIDAVRALADAFAGTVGAVASARLPEAVAELGPATLTAGVAIAHVKDDLRQVRREAHEALDDAKAARRRALATARATAAPLEPERWGWVCVRELPRAGSTRSCVGPVGGLSSRHHLLRRLLAGERISLSLAHDLLSAARELDDREAEALGTRGLDLARATLRQKLRRSGRDDDATSADLNELQQHLTSVATWADVHALAAEMLLAERVVRVGAQRTPWDAALP